MYMYYDGFIVFLCAEKDWEDIRKMPEFATLMKDFGRLRPKYSNPCAVTVL